LIRRRSSLVALAATGLALSNGAAAASDCKLIQVAEWPVRVERNKLIVDGAINGQNIGVMLDTGTTKSLILRAAAVRLGLPRQKSRRDRMFGVGGETTVEIATVDEFRVGQFVRRNPRMYVAGDQDFGENVAVLLGEDFLQHVDVEFDLAHRAIRLYEPRDCDGVSLAHWTRGGAGEVEIEAFDVARPQILLTIQINGKPVRALLDSGAATSMLSKADAARLGVTPETPGVVAIGSGTGLGSKSVASWVGPFQSFTIGNETIKDTEIMFADLFKDAEYRVTGSHLPIKVDGLDSMLLGADFLRAHRVMVAHSQRKVYFTYAGGPVFQRMRPPAPGNMPRLEDDAKRDASQD
jgi:predicted aspartyl protease